MKIIPYTKHHVTEDDIQAVVATLKSSHLTCGPKIGEYEEKFAAAVGAKYAVAVSSGTAALHISMMAMGLSPHAKRDTVITTPNTFAATANAVRYMGAEVAWVDIDEKTYNLDLNLVEERAKKGDCVGVIPVDFAGYPVNITELRWIAEKYDLWIVRDGCHAIGGATIQGGETIAVGSGKYANLTVFSTHAAKNITTGEGGMVTTDSSYLMGKLLKARAHGVTHNVGEIRNYDGAWNYDQIMLGYNYRMPDINAALGISQLNRLEQIREARQRIASKYLRDMISLRPRINMPSVEENVIHAWHLFVVRTPERKKLYYDLKERGIHAQVHYLPTHKLSYYRQRYGSQKLPNAEKYYEECLSLPMYPSLTDEDQDRVVEAIKDSLGA